MKRALVPEYASDSDSDDEPQSALAGPAPSEPVAAPAKKRKLLPALSGHFRTAPVDNPAQHQGRTRTVPFVQGQWCAHVYVPVDLPPSLHKTLRALLARAKARCPTLHSLLDPPARAAPAPDPGGSTHSNPAQDSPPEELHISLTRPLFLRAHERRPFLASVRRAVRSHSASRFDLSFADLAVLENDERTRAFLTCEVGAGFTELRALTTSLEPAVRELRQEAYYQEPRYHASIGWALLARPAVPSTPEPNAGHPNTAAPPAATKAEAAAPSRVGPVPPHPSELGLGFELDFPTIASFPEGFLRALQKEFGERIREAVGVGEVRVRIGREETRVGLG
ncbi:hypothetical protein CALCODRAFT_480806 [Calocera cornea HHB12733]|uniref:U6 snRNA phosphodiesterase 1 n=1 Tax=Calocera cornea HHB12733 TaxID=1353952 RepID=A0A165I992_9BASI|nr:hypothetical protein CALCODRAFT_480806 [Calocera cornea HHB12733]